MLQKKIFEENQLATGPEVIKKKVYEYDFRQTNYWYSSKIYIQILLWLNKCLITMRKYKFTWKFLVSASWITKMSFSTEVWGWDKEYSSTTSRTHVATTSGGICNRPVPMAGKANVLNFLMSAIERQFSTNLLRT